MTIKLRLIYVLDHGYSNINGYPHTTHGNKAMLDRLLKNFDEIIILCRDRSSSLLSEYKKIDNSNVKVVELKDFKSISEYIKTSLHNRNILKKYIASADVVFGLGFNGSLAIKLAKKKGKTCVGYIGGCGLLSYKNTNSIKEKVKSIIFYFKQRSLAKKADFMQYVAQYLHRTYPTYGRSFFASSIKIPFPDRDTKQNRYKKEYSYETPIKIGLIGYTHTPIKGIDTAIRALSKLENRYTLQVVGRGDHVWLDNLAKEFGVSERVEFLGTMPGGQAVWNWLDTVDIYIQPSISEGMPRATIEAMFRGCPVISTNVGGLCDIVPREWRIAPGDYEELSQLIRKMASNYETLHDSMLKSFKTAEQFSENILGKKYDDFWRSVIQAQGCD